MSETKTPEDMSPEEMREVAKRFNEQQRQSQTMRRKIDQLDRELQDHVLVLQQLEPLDADRRCFRLIGGVLVERTVGEVRPLIDTQKGQLLELLNKMAEQLKVIEDEVRFHKRGQPRFLLCVLAVLHLCISPHVPYFLPPPQICYSSIHKALMEYDCIAYL